MKIGFFGWLILLSLEVKAQSIYTIYKHKDLYGVKNAKGQVLLKPLYAQIASPKGMLIPVKNTFGLWGFYKDKEKITECLYNNFSILDQDRILVQKDSKWGLINATGQVLIPNVYRHIKAEERQYLATRPNYWCVRNFKNEILYSFELDSVSYAGNNVFKYCLVGNYGLMDRKGKIITTEYHDIYPPKPYQYPQKITLPQRELKGELKDSTYLKMNRALQKVYAFSEGMARMRMHHLYGFIDKAGNIRLVPQYANARDFHEGMVAIVLKGKWGFMDSMERLKVQPYYDEVSDFSRGVALVREETKYNFVNKTGRELYAEDLEAIHPTEFGKYILRQGNYYGMADEEGREIIPLRYDFLHLPGNGYVFVKKDGLWGVMDYNGNLVIPMSFDVIEYIYDQNLILTGEPGKVELLRP